MSADRSEERSRFEKWAVYNILPVSSGHIFDRAPNGHYILCQSQNLWECWLTALEDRQEAAPLHRVVIDNTSAQFTALSLEMCVHSQGGHFQDRMRTFPSAKFHMWCDLGRMLQNRGVPSEATPNKENAHLGDPCVYCNTPHDDVPPGPCKGHIKCAVCGYTERDKCHDRTVLRTLGLEEKYHPFAPAPEVQGTPKMIRCETCFGHGRPVMNNEDGDNCPDCGGLGRVRAPESPVGAPQKETPRFRIYNPGGENHGQLIEPTPHPAHETVPEGVQGKEPQTPDFDKWREEEERSPYFGRKAFSRLAFNAGKASGEAAGRRSAITELQKWARVDEGAGDMTGPGAVIAKCAELLEKTK